MTTFTPEDDAIIDSYAMAIWLTGDQGVYDRYFTCMYDERRLETFDARKPWWDRLTAIYEQRREGTPHDESRLSQTGTVLP